jgi:hypothetical protein
VFNLVEVMYEYTAEYLHFDRAKNYTVAGVVTFCTV